MNRKWILPVIVVTILVIITVVLLIVATAVFEPENTNPAFKTAGDFVRAVFDNDDAAAMPLLDANLQTYITANCPSVSACIQSYIPAEWGAVQGVTYRRSVPDGRAWDVEWIASFAQGVGASGVCIYTRVEPQADDRWLVTEWAGFIHCGDPASRNMATNPDTPNRVP